MRITDNPVNHPNAPDDAEIELKPHAPDINFIDVNNEHKFPVVIFVDFAAKKEERLLQKEKMLDSNSFEIIVDKKFKLHTYLFLFLIEKSSQKFQKYVFLFLIKMKK